MCCRAPQSRCTGTGMNLPLWVMGFCLPKAGPKAQSWRWHSLQRWVRIGQGDIHNPSQSVANVASTGQNEVRAPVSETSVRRIQGQWTSDDQKGLPHWAGREEKSLVPRVGRHPVGLLLFLGRRDGTSGRYWDGRSSILGYGIGFYYHIQHILVSKKKKKKEKDFEKVVHSSLRVPERRPLERVARSSAHTHGRDL